MCRQISSDRLSVPFMYTNIRYKMRPKVVCDTQLWWEAQPTDSRHSPATSCSCLAGMASSPPSTASFLPFVKLFCKQDQTNSAHKRLPLPSRLLFNQLPCFLQNLETLRWHPWKDSNTGEGAARGGQMRLASIDIDTQKMV